MLSCAVDCPSIPAFLQQLPYFHILRTTAPPTPSFSHPCAKTPGGGSSHPPQFPTRNSPSLQNPPILRQATARFPENLHAHSEDRTRRALRHDAVRRLIPLRPSPNIRFRIHHHPRWHAHRRHLPHAAQEPTHLHPGRPHRKSLRR